MKPYITQTGKVLTDADIEALSAEAERGYDVNHMKVRIPYRCATHFVIPTTIATKQDREIHIGKFPEGIRVYKNYGEGNTIVLKADGDWDAIGEPFESFGEAYEALLKTPYAHRGRLPK